MWKREREWELDRDMRTAWHVAALTRGAQDLPKLETLLVSKTGGRPRQSQKEMVATWQAIAARFGGTFVPVTKH
jgi:hypothetical protein